MQACNFEYKTYYKEITLQSLKSPEDWKALKKLFHISSFLISELPWKIIVKNTNIVAFLEDPKNDFFWGMLKSNPQEKVQFSASNNLWPSSGMGFGSESQILSTSPLFLQLQFAPFTIPTSKNNNNISFPSKHAIIRLVYKIAKYKNYKKVWWYSLALLFSNVPFEQEGL